MYTGQIRRSIVVRAFASNCGQLGTWDTAAPRGFFLAESTGHPAPPRATDSPHTPVDVSPGCDLEFILCVCGVCLSQKYRCPNDVHESNLFILVGKLVMCFA